MSRHHPIPFHASLDTKLLRIGKDYLTARDIFESISILGGSGSGKTSASMAAFLRAYLAAGYGGIFCVAKNDAVKEIQKAAAATGRTDDLVYIDASPASNRINLLDYVSEHLGGEGFDQNLVSFMEHMMEASRKASGTGGGGSDGDNRYFSDAAMKMASHAFPLLRAAWGTIRMSDLYEFITSVPMTAAEAVSEDWKKTFCYETHAKLAVLHKQAIAEGRPDARLARVIKEHGNFFLDEISKLDPRPKTSVISTLTNSLYPMLSGVLHDLFCTTTTISPLAAREGKILVLNLPVHTYGAGGIVAQVLLKYLCGLAWQNTPVDARTRPVFVAADEAQFFLAGSDADLLSTARSAKISVCYATQDLPTYYAKLGSNSRDVAESILSKFGTRIFHANTSIQTNEAAATIVGKTEKFHLTETRSRGNTSGAGGNRHDQSGGFHGNSGANISSGQSTSGYLDFEIPPDYFATSLRTGGKANHYKVDAIVVRNGRNWKETGRHWVKAEFRQR